MVKYLFGFLILIHGIIHLKGFFREAGVPATTTIEKRPRVAWLIVTSLFVLTFILLLLNQSIWWMPGLVAIAVSQVLIGSRWSEAKFGTALNIIILLGLIVGFFDWSFMRTYQKDVARNVANTDFTFNNLLSSEDLLPLPEPVQRYLLYTGAVGKPKVKSFKVEFEGRLRESDSAAWMPFSSEQYNFLDKPSRFFFLNATMKHLPVAGYHRYFNGDASMDIRLISMIKVAYATGKEMSISETVTFFNDMCVMAPATLIDERIKWLAVEGNKVHASFTTNNITISAWLYFNSEGQLINFISDDRYALQGDGTMRRMRWSTPMKDYREINGYKLATYADAIYQYPSHELCYGTFNTTNVQYNLRENDY